MCRSGNSPTGVAPSPSTLSSRTPPAPTAQRQRRSPKVAPPRAESAESAWTVRTSAKTAPSALESNSPDLNKGPLWKEKGMAYVLTPPSTVGVPVNGTKDLFPVRRIYCVGRNYAAHAREMGHDPDREPPFFFSKPADAIVLCADPKNPAKVAYPSSTKNLHHEMELVVAMKSGGTNIAVDEPLDCVCGYGVGLDMTRRDLQNQAKDMGRPWDIGKGFDQSSPIGEIYPAAKIR